MPESIGDHHQHTAAPYYNNSSTLPLSRIFQLYQAFLMDPLSRSPAKRSKAAEVVENIWCVNVIYLLKLIFASYV